VNVRRQNEWTHALLQTASYDILLLQEPWFYTIGTHRSDTDPFGSDILGTVSHPHWTCFTPHTPNPLTDVCKVSAYIRTSLLSTSLLVHPCYDLAPSSLTCLILDIILPSETLSLVTYYHLILDGPGHGLTNLLGWSPDDNILTVLCGDLNTHSLSWSLPHATTSPWAATLEDWFEAAGFTLTSCLQIPTWHGTSDQADSVLDLVLVNAFADTSGALSCLSTSFVESLGSNHALIHFTWSLTASLPTEGPPRPPSFTVDNNLRPSWTAAFARLPSPCLRLRSDVLIAATALLSDIVATSASLFLWRSGCPDPHGAPWWNSACSATLLALQTCNRDAQQAAAHIFCKTVRTSKREYFNELLFNATSDSLWATCAWRKGRRNNLIPPLRCPASPVSALPGDLNDALASQFFPPA
jgi:hypothetical protein